MISTWLEDTEILPHCKGGAVASDSRCHLETHLGSPKLLLLVGKERELVKVPQIQRTTINTCSILTSNARCFNSYSALKASTKDCASVRGAMVS
jgi:hypothetical protein